MKTIKQWLEELPEPYRTQALENLKSDKYDSIEKALLNAFDWWNSPEGWNYWSEFYMELDKKNNLVDKG